MTKERLSAKETLLLVKKAKNWIKDNNGFKLKGSLSGGYTIEIQCDIFEDRQRDKFYVEIKDPQTGRLLTPHTEYSSFGMGEIYTEINYKVGATFPIEEARRRSLSDLRKILEERE